jgi:hypothetical protein
MRDDILKCTSSLSFPMRCILKCHLVNVIASILFIRKCRFYSGSLFAKRYILSKCEKTQIIDVIKRQRLPGNAQKKPADES